MNWLIVILGVAIYATCNTSTAAVQECYQTHLRSSPHPSETASFLPPHWKCSHRTKCWWLIIQLGILQLTVYCKFISTKPYLTNKIRSNFERKEKESTLYQTLCSDPGSAPWTAPQLQPVSSALTIVFMWCMKFICGSGRVQVVDKRTLYLWVVQTAQVGSRNWSGLGFKKAQTGTSLPARLKLWGQPLN